MKIAEDVLMTLLSDTFAILIFLGLLTLSDRNRKRRNFEERCFFYLCLTGLGMAAADGAAYLMIDKSLSSLRLPAILLYTIEEILVLAVVWQWILYIDYQIYNTRDHLKRRYRWTGFVFAVATALYVINIFTGFIFTVDERLVMCWETGYPFMLVMETAGFFYPVYELYRYSKRRKIVYFMQAWPVIVPVILDVIVSSLTVYSVTALCFASSLTFFYFFMMNRWRFVDESSGFYNSAYMDFLKRLKKEGKRDYNHIIAFSAKKDTSEELCHSLRDNAPSQSDIIRENDGRFLLCTAVTNRDALFDLGVFIKSGAEGNEPEDEIKFDILDFDSYTV